MADIVSLRLHRKRRDRAKRGADAAENRASFGRTREERELSQRKRAREAEKLDSHKREE